MIFLQVVYRATLAISVSIPLSAYAGTFTSLYRFSGKGDGGTPVGPLVYQDGVIYGITSDLNDPPDKGSVFRFDIATLTLTVLYRFTGGTDGMLPTAMLYHKGTIYGTTWVGGGTGCGNPGCGTVFSVNSTTGAETILYRFPDPGNHESSLPRSLIYYKNALYGATANGGTYSQGSVFSINLKSGTETELYDFTAGPDGAEPGSNLLLMNGLLYGATQYGGSNCGRGSGGCGTVFTVHPTTGAFSTLHTFALDAGGYLPESNLVEHEGLIYGSTAYGGDLSCGKIGCGTVFSIDPHTGSYDVVETLMTNHQLVPGLTARGANLYESVQAPPGRRNWMAAGQLAKFDLKSSKREVLHKFDGGRNGTGGSEPLAPLVYAHGVFYGSTETGGGTGCNSYGCGTLFQYVP